MRALLIPLLATFGLLAAPCAHAQPTPFRMAPGATAPAAPAMPGPALTPAAAPGGERPFDMRGTSAPASPVAPAREPLSPAPGTFPAIRNAGAQAQRGLTRPILPFETMRLEGETDARTWAFFLTQDEAASGRSLSLGYQNAVVVMPEASTLRVWINGESIAETPIVSAQGIKRMVFPIRSGLLRTGQNVIRVEAVQRHRTDCTTKATYELWTDVDSASTSLIFAEGAPRTLRTFEDLPAVGVDTHGVTTIRVVAPRLYRPEIRDRLLHLVQFVALRGRYAHPVVQVMEADPGPSPVGTIKVMMGVASELRTVMANMPEAATRQPLALMMQDPGSAAPVLLVSGPTWADLDSAITVLGGRLFNDDQERKTVDTATWLWPEPPILTGGNVVSLADLGVSTQEFSGRLFRDRFTIDLPSDFYANDYGEANLFLDAAYAPSVQPGSHIAIYVNDRISATMTITSRGHVFRRYPVRIPMRNFRPGLNHIRFETVLMTAADDRCAPGATLSEANRFALFDTTSLSIPVYGRVGRVPDLASLGSGSFPYNGVPAAFSLSRQTALNYSAAGTLLTRLALDRHAPVRAYFVNAASASDSSVVQIGAVDQLPRGLLQRVGVSDNLRSLWQSTPGPNWSYPTAAPAPEGSLTMVASAAPPDKTGAEPAEPASTEEIRRRWTQTLQTRGILQDVFDGLRDWMEATFNLSLSKLSLNNDANRLYEPPQRSTLLVAQGFVDGEGTRTLVTARTEEALAEEMARLTGPRLWSQLSGRIAALAPSENKLEIKPVDTFVFVRTQPFSIGNLRLVAANWMSVNILQYALLLVACCALLGIATYLLLRQLRRS